MAFTRSVNTIHTTQSSLREQVKLASFLLGLLAFFGFGIAAPEWYFGIVATGLGIAMLIRWPMVGLVGMALTAPFINIEAQWGAMHVPVVDVIALATTVAVGLRSVAMHWAGGVRPDQSLRRVQGRLPGMTQERRITITSFQAPIVFFVLFLAVAAASVVHADDVWLSIKYLLRPLLFFAIAYLTLPIAVVTTERRRNALLWSFVLVGAVVAAMGLLSLWGQHDVAVRRVIPIPVFGVYPFGTNQNQIAEVLLFTLPAMALLREYTATALRARRTWMLAMLPVAFVLLATLSRAGAIALLVELCIVLALILRPTLRQIAIGSVLLVLLLSPFLGSLIRLATVEAGQSANENRLILTTAAVELWRQHPWIGNGVGTFMPLLSQDRRYIAKFGEALDAHGILQKLIAEVGVFGAALFGFFWLSIALVFWHAYTSANPQSVTPPAGGGSRDGGTIRPPEVDPPLEDNPNIQALWLALFFGTSVFQLFGTSYFLGRFWLPIGVGLAATAGNLANRNEKL